MFGYADSIWVPQALACRWRGAAATAPYTVTTTTTAITMSNYDQLHRQCRTLENLFDAKLTSYSQLVSSLSRPQDLEANGSSERWRDLELELDDLSAKVRKITPYDAAHILTECAAARD